MANLLVITGNTALKAAWSDGTVLGKTFRYQGEKMLDYLLQLQVHQQIIYNYQIHELSE